MDRVVTVPCLLLATLAASGSIEAQGLVETARSTCAGARSALARAEEALSLAERAQEECARTRRIVAAAERDSAQALATTEAMENSAAQAREQETRSRGSLRLAEELSAELLRIRQDTSTLADPQHSRAIGEVRASDAQWGPSGAGNVELGGPRNLGKARMQIANARRLAEELASDLELML